MLTSMRTAFEKGILRIVLFALMALLIASFAVWGIADVFRGFGAQTVATIGKTEISVEQFREIYNRQIQAYSRQLNQPVTPDLARVLGIEQRILQNLVQESTLDERARQMDLGISDPAIARRISENPQFRAPNGQFDQQYLQLLLRQFGMTEQMLVVSERRIATRAQLIDAVSGGIAVPQTFVELVHRFVGEKRVVEYFTLGAPSAGELPDPTPEDLAKFFEARKAEFKTQELRKILIMPLTAEALAGKIQVSDDEIKTRYERDLAKYGTPERRTFLQLSFPTLDEAQAARQRITSGQATFQQIAEERKVTERDMLFAQATKASLLDKTIAEAVFAATENAVTEPVKGALSTALVLVTKIEPATVKPLAEVSADIRKELTAEKSRPVLTDLNVKIEDERAGGTRLAEIAKKLDIPLVTIEAVDREGRDAGGLPVGEFAGKGEILPAAFRASEGTDNPPVTLGAEGLLFYEVAGITPSRERTLDEVKADVETKWREAKLKELLSAKAEALVAKIKAGTAIGTVASEEGLVVQVSDPFSRDVTSPTFSADAVTQMFRTPKDGAGQVAATDGIDRIVYRVTTSEVPPINPADPGLKTLIDRFKTDFSNDITTTYVRQLEQEIGVTLNREAIRQVTGAN